MQHQCSCWYICPYICMIGYCRNDGYLGCFGQEALHELTGVYVTLPQHDLLNMNTFSSETVCDDGLSS